jgi:hypothetical protein
MVYQRAYMKNKQEKLRLSITVTAELYAWLKVRAEVDGRSLAGLVNKILNTTKKEEKKTHMTV